MKVYVGTLLCAFSVLKLKHPYAVYIDTGSYQCHLFNVPFLFCVCALAILSFSPTVQGVL